MKRALPFLLAAVTLALAAAVLAQAPAVNGPAEWRWPFRPPGLAPVPALWALLAAAGLIALALRPPAAGRGLGLPAALAALAGAALTFALTLATPGGIERVMGSLASRNSFGFVWDAGLAPGSGELLADYPRASAALNQHSRTHPPGPLLAVRALDAVRAPALFPESWLAAAERAAAHEISRARDRHRPAPAALAAPATFAALAFLLPLAGALAALPLAALARAWGLAPEAALLAAALWLLVPARSLFTPSLDQALPLLLVGAAALAAGGGLRRAAGAGLLLAAACFLTWGYLAAVPLVLLIAAAEGAGDGRGDRGGRRGLLRLGPLGSLGWRAPAAAAAAFAAPWLALRAAAGFDAPRALAAALAVHRQIAVDSRSPALWLRWNPYDFALLAGPAVVGLALAALFLRRKTWPAWRLPLWGFWGLLLALWLSGSVRGEVGRIWAMWMPFACLFAAAALGPRDAAAPDGRGDGTAARAALLASQAALLLALAAAMVFVS